MNINIRPTKFFRRYFILTTIIVSFVVSALVGGVFGYYGGSLLFSNTLILPTFIKQLVGPSAKQQEQSQIYPDEQSRVIEVVKKNSPAVVSIVATKDLTIIEQGRINPFQDFCNDPFFRQFLGSQCDESTQQPKSRTETQQVAAGTGFLISADGMILTNKHVIDISGAGFTAITNDGKKYPAQVLAKDPVQDLAILKINGSGLSFLTLGDSSKVQIGQTVIAIGNALGQFSNTVSKGVISGLLRSIVAGDGAGASERLDQVIQTDAAINPGNSGGPLLNLSGEVIGVNTAIVEGAQNIGFAIPINQAKRDIDQVKKIGKISYPFLGVRYIAINEEVKQKNNLPVDYGVLVIDGSQGETGVVAGSPAEKAGIKTNDIILEINGNKIDQNNDLAKLLQSYNPGDSVRLKILSQGQEKVITIILTERT